MSHRPCESSIQSSHPIQGMLSAQAGSPQTSLMKSRVSCWHRYRFPARIISHGVWLYRRFCLSFGMSRSLLVERGVIVTHETVRQRCQKFGLDYARKLRRRLGDIWHLDELFVNVQGMRRCLWPVLST
jgi:putative transposase